MIRTNLSTRPFYNERLVRLALAGLAIVAVAFTAFDVMRVYQYSRSDTSLAIQAARDEARASDLRASAARLRASVDSRQIEVASAEAELANTLIDRRTFSWTELLNTFEATLPDEARISSVRPRIDAHGAIELRVTLVAQSVEQVNTFMERLDATGAFMNLSPSEEHFNDEQQLEVTLVGLYAPGASPAKARPATGGRK